MHRSGMNSHLSIFNSYQHSTYRFAPSPTLPRLFCLEYFQANPRLCKQLSMHLRQIGLLYFISFLHNNIAIITSNRISNNPLTSHRSLTLKFADCLKVMILKLFCLNQDLKKINMLHLIAMALNAILFSNNPSLYF